METLRIYYVHEGDFIRKYIFLLLILFIPIASATNIHPNMYFSPTGVDTNFTFAQYTVLDSIRVPYEGLQIDGDYFISIPDSGHVEIEIYNFSTTDYLYRQFNATNTISDNVSFEFSGYNSGQNVSLYVDSILNKSLVANTTGYVSFEINITQETNITLFTVEITVPETPSGGGGGGGGDKCDYTHLYLCYDKISCEYYEGYWYDDECHETPKIIIPIEQNIINETINEGIDYLENITGLELNYVNISYEDITYEDILSASLDSSLIRLPIYELVNGEYVLTGYLDIRPSEIIEFGISILPSLDGDLSESIMSFLGYEIISLPKMSVTGEYTQEDALSINVGLILFIVSVIGIIYYISRKKNKK